MYLWICCVLSCMVYLLYIGMYIVIVLCMSLISAVRSLVNSWRVDTVSVCLSLSVNV